MRERKNKAIIPYRLVLLLTNHNITYLNALEILFTLTINIILNKLLRLHQAILQYLKPHSSRKVVYLDLLGFVFKNLYQKSFAENTLPFLPSRFISMSVTLNIKIIYNYPSLTPTMQINRHTTSFINKHYITKYSKKQDIFG